MLDRFAAFIDQHQRRRLLGFAVLLGLHLACQWDPYYSSYTRKEPRRSDLVGWYEPKKESRDFIDQKGYGGSGLVVMLNADGTFSIDGMPDMWSDGFGHPNGRLERAAGRWEVDQIQEGIWGISLFVSRSSNTAGIQSDKPFVRPVGLIGDRPPYIVHFTIGDPDQGEAIQCVRLDQGRVLYSKQR
jgi:hypothetical protein